MRLVIGTVTHPHHSKEGRAGAPANVERLLLPEGAREGDVIALPCPLGGGAPQTVRRALSGARVDRRATEERGARVRNRIEHLKRRGEQS